jgi:hypothetical protein
MRGSTTQETLSAPECGSNAEKSWSTVSKFCHNFVLTVKRATSVYGQHTVTMQITEQ